MNPNEMPKHRQPRPVQGRYEGVARKWRRLGDDQGWDRNPSE